MNKRLIIFIFILCVLYINTGEAVLTHSGRTDSNGGHTCRTNCSSYDLSYGQYHFHNGT
ncbi:YHYH domain-containing protein [Bacillus sp. SM2101]|uniref:YHYH domain-containing protein n=1 Tax=Bacillus sp. SM2101 TaxID=2805366 RepID=UPI001BDEFD07|nr:YHYH domain-containing protein [Bacillus sp. SM2101]